MAGSQAYTHGNARRLSAAERKLVLTRRWTPDASGMAGKEDAGRKALLARPLPPFARPGAAPLLVAGGERGEVVKAPCEGDLADVSGLIRGVGKVALAALQPLRLHVAAERGLFGG